MLCLLAHDGSWKIETKAREFALDGSGCLFLHTKGALSGVLMGNPKPLLSQAYAVRVESRKRCPCSSDIAAAPEFVLDIISCSCKISKNICGTKLCSCRKNDLACVATCNDCRGTSCNNVSGDKSDTILDNDILEHS